jgi:hypothetical protein
MRASTYNTEIKVAISDETPVKMIMTFVSLLPVPPLDIASMTDAIQLPRGSSEEAT